MMNLCIKAMLFAQEKHKNQQRKYTENPYFDHLAEVAGITSTLYGHDVNVLCIAWLHDTVEDTETTLQEIEAQFNSIIAMGVGFLSDIEEGNRETRKRLSRERLMHAPSHVQTIKVADLISNTSSIVKHDPDFARVYLEEKRLLLDVLTKAHPALLEIARNQAQRF
jgi:guanosine-3',5'-bis(diphosphate) 3'-pyrophosphohydrolase